MSRTTGHTINRYQGHKLHLAEKVARKYACDAIEAAAMIPSDEAYDQKLAAKAADDLVYAAFCQEQDKYDYATFIDREDSDRWDSEYKAGIAHEKDYSWDAHLTEDERRAQEL